MKHLLFAILASPLGLNFLFIRHHKVVFFIPGESISPNFFCQAKRRWRTAFGKKIAIQFHQHYSPKLWCQICQFYDLKVVKSVCCSPFAMSCAKKASFFWFKKLCKNVGEINSGCRDTLVCRVFLLVCQHIIPNLTFSFWSIDFL